MLSQGKKFTFMSFNFGNTIFDLYFPISLFSLLHFFTVSFSNHQWNLIGLLRNLLRIVLFSKFTCPVAGQNVWVTREKTNKWHVSQVTEVNTNSEKSWWGHHPGLQVELDLSGVPFKDWEQYMTGKHIREIVRLPDQSSLKPSKPSKPKGLEELLQLREP